MRLRQALINEDFKMVETLIERGVDLELRDEWGDTALLQSTILFARNEEIPYLLMTNGADVNAYNSIRDSTPLVYTIYANKYTIAKQLLDNGADINWSNRDGLTPLMLAIFYDKVDLAHLIIEKGTDIHRQNNIGWNALIYAIIREYKDLVELLLSKNIKFDIEDTYGETAMKFALQCKDSSIKDILVQYGANENFYNFYPEEDILIENENSFFNLKRNSLKITDRKILLEEKTPFKEKNRIELYLYQLVDYTILFNKYGGVMARESPLANNETSIDLNYYNSIGKIIESFVTNVRKKGYLTKEEIVEIQSKR